MEVTYCGKKEDKLLVKINGGEPMLLTIDELYKLSIIDEKQTKEELDWQSLRNQAAIAAMQRTITILGSSDRYAFRDIVVEGYKGNEKTYPNEISQFAVACANALIKELKKK